jgi:hypothetical protein
MDLFKSLIKEHPAELIEALYELRKGEWSEYLMNGQMSKKNLLLINSADVFGLRNFEFVITLIAKPKRFVILRPEPKYPQHETKSLPRIPVKPKKKLVIPQKLKRN